MDEMNLIESRELYEKGRSSMEEGNLDEAIEYFEGSNREAPHFKTLELLGECLRKKNRIKESIVPLAAAVALNRGVRARSLLAESLLGVGEFHQAKEHAEEIISQSPNNCIAAGILQRLNHNQSELDNA